MAGGRPALDANKGNYAVDLLMVVYGLHTKVCYPKPEGWKLGDLIKAQHFQQVIHEGLQDGSVTAAAPAGPRESHPLFKDLSGRPWHRLKCQTVAAYRRILTTAVKRYNADPNVRAPTTEKSFGKNLRTFGLTLDEGEKAFTFDLAKWQNHSTGFSRVESQRKEAVRWSMKSRFQPHLDFTPNSGAPVHGHPPQGSRRSGGVLLYSKFLGSGSG